MCAFFSDESKAEESPIQTISRTSTEQQELMNAIPKDYKLEELSGLQRGLYGNLYGNVQMQSFGWYRVMYRTYIQGKNGQVGYKMSKQLVKH